MIYLFNSGYRALYRTNVLNTLFLPNGCTNEYRYRASGTPRYVAPDAYQSLKQAPRGEKAVIVFIDRFGNGGYVYHPLRLGELVITREENEQLFFRVKLQDFIYPRDLAEFNRQIAVSLIPHGLPRLAGANPESTADGYYAIPANSIFEQKEGFHFGQAAWLQAVESLYKTKAFASTATDQVVFVRGELKNKSAVTLAPSLQNDSAVYDILKNSNYELVLTYRYPLQLSDQTKRAELELELGENLRPLGGKTIGIDSHANSEGFVFATKKFLEDDESSISFKFNALEPGATLLGPNRDLRFRIKDSRMFWLQIGLTLLLLSVLSVFMGIDLSKLKPLTLGNFFSQQWTKVLGGIAQTFVLFWMFRLIGKKVL
jgi:hypothetical protein